MIEPSGSAQVDALVKAARITEADAIVVWLRSHRTSLFDDIAAAIERGDHHRERSPFPKNPGG